MYKWRYSEFLRNVERGKVIRVTMRGDGEELVAMDKQQNLYWLQTLPADPDLLATLERHHVEVAVVRKSDPSSGRLIVRNIVFPVVASLVIFVMARKLQNALGIGNMFDVTKSGARIGQLSKTQVTFKDVAGADGAKMELEEVVQFLKESERFTEVGARIPRGVILEGPPGTGKTMLARAVAGEAGVPFFSIAGSEFVEMFVGVGASRVRDLFSQAKRNAPCIVFIDEIDAVGRRRGEGYAGGNDEREQTLNQLLTEMDGFDGNNGVIVIAATNRPDVLDSALVRPGRFDRRIVVDLPDYNGRMAILRVHASKKVVSPAADLSGIARRTPGFSGASLANLLNEAAIRAARRGLKEIGQDELEDALDRLTVGAEKKDAVMPEHKKRLIAYHEAGHAIVGMLTPNYDRVAKVTIVPRGSAGGLTFFSPEESRVDSGLFSRQFLEGQLAVALGGRVAEEIVFGEDDVTTGAANDFEQVTRVATQMVTRFGFSDSIGQIVVESQPANPWMGRSQRAHVSSATKALVDKEVSRLVKEAHVRARELLLANRSLLDTVAERLVERESISGKELLDLVKAKKVRMMTYPRY